MSGINTHHGENYTKDTDRKGQGHEDIANVVDIEIEGPNDELVHYIFEGQYAERITGLMHYFLDQDKHAIDAILASKILNKPIDKDWNVMVGQLTSQDVFSFVQHDSVPQHIFKRDGTKKHLIVLHLQKDFSNKHKIKVTPKIVEIFPHTSLLPNGYVASHDLETIEDYKKAEQGTV